MDDPIEYKPDWLEQTWEIKRHIAKRYAGVPMSEQLRDMEARVRKAWAERGWTYPEPSLAGLPPRLETTVKK